MDVKIIKNDREADNCWLVYESFLDQNYLVKVCWSFDSAWQNARNLNPEKINFYTTKKDMINDK